jgi:hypothetical protein
MPVYPVCANALWLENATVRRRIRRIAVAWEVG